MLGIGVDPEKSLVLSQVVLSFDIPVALIPLVLPARRADVMGTAVSSTYDIAFLVVGALLVVAGTFTIRRRLRRPSKGSS